MLNYDEVIESREVPVRAYEPTSSKYSSRMSDEDMILRSVEDPRYAVFGYFD
ncbi:MAG: hypothetical protein ACP5N7_01155 [Candidatus Pacearchaeota archaeon]